jgi:ribose transport system ATP-binding protein
VFALADRIAVMRDGQLVGVAPTQELTAQQVVQMMVGRELKEFYPRTARLAKGGDGDQPLLRATGLRRGNDLLGIDLVIYPGEIVGLAGLVGAGRSYVARALFGVDHLEAGEIWIDGKLAHIHSPMDAVRYGLGFVPEDRKSQGLFLGQSVRTNAAISMLRQFSRLGFLNFRAIERMVRNMVEKLGIRTPSIAQRVRNLSGGNQQKVVISRWLALNPKVLILDEPTRGVDVAAKAEIHGLMNELAVQGMGILMISSELPEVLSVSDRILVMREGEIVAELPRNQATQDAIMRAATGQQERTAL